MDKLVICKRCGSDACYAQEVNESITNYQCMGCGFISNSLMKVGTDFMNEQVEVLPELYKDLFFEDEEGCTWMPSTVNIPTMGMVFANGTDKNNWAWAAVKAVKITEEEREAFKKKDGTFYEFRMDMDTLRNYPEREYIEALEYIGVFQKSE
jgi:hypothetical protein